MIAIDDKCDLVPSSTFATFAQHMTRLHIGSVRSQCDIFGILACCPKLTHFSSSARVHVSRTRTTKSTLCLNLQYLRINHCINTEQLLDIMRASPKMRHLRLKWHSNIDLIQIVDTRPELDMITFNIFPSLGQDPLWMDDHDITPCKHLRTLEFANVLHETPLHHLMAILNCSWGKGLERLVCEIGRLYKSKDTMRRMPPIMLPPDTCQLQEFIYNSHKPDMDDIHDPEDTIMLPILSRCKQLQSIALDMDAGYDGRSGRPLNDQMLPDLAPFNHLPQLRHLSIHEFRDDLSDLSFMFLQMRHFQIQLESFEYQICALDTALEFVGALRMIPTMRHLILKEVRPGCITTRGLKDLARHLQESSPIHTLTLKRCYTLQSVTGVEALCNMTSIKHLIIDTRFVNAFGLRNLANQHPSLESLELIDVVTSGFEKQDMVKYLASRINRVVVH